MDSSVIEYATYDHGSETLRIEFKRTGKEYEYRGVPSEVAEKYLRAPSKGRFFATEIKPNYECVPVTA